MTIPSQMYSFANMLFFVKRYVEVLFKVDVIDIASLGAI